MMSGKVDLAEQERLEAAVVEAAVARQIARIHRGTLAFFEAVCAEEEAVAALIAYREGGDG